VINIYSSSAVSHHGHRECFSLPSPPTTANCANVTKNTVSTGLDLEKALAILKMTIKKKLESGKESNLILLHKCYLTVEKRYKGKLLTTHQYTSSEI